MGEYDSFGLLVALTFSLPSLFNGGQGLNASSVWSDLKAASLPFLRCAALFYHHLTNVPGPAELAHFSDDEFEVLTKYLSLPSTPAELLNPSSPRLQLLVKKCADHPRVHSLRCKTLLSDILLPN